MAAGDTKLVIAASSALTQTGLDGIATSATWVAGWTSAAIDNSSNLYLDYLISAQFQVESAGISAGQIRMYLYTQLSDSGWPDIFSAGTEGTEGTATLHDTNIRDSLYLLWATDTDTTASQFYVMPQTSLLARIGFVPRRFALFVAQSTGAALETTGDPNVVHTQGVYANVAQS